MTRRAFRFAFRAPPPLMLALACAIVGLRRRSRPPRRDHGRHRHLLRRRGARSVSVHRGREESRGRRVDEGAGRLHARRRSIAFRGRAALLAEDRRTRRRSPGARRRRPGQQRSHLLSTSALRTRTSRSSTCARDSRGKERLLVDPEAIKGAGGKHYAIDYFAPSLDNKYVAYGISPGGSEESVLHVIEVATGKETGEAIDRAQFGPPGWTDDNRLLYNRLQKLAPGAPPSDKYLKSRVYVHAIGSDPEQRPRDPGSRRRARTSRSTRSRLPFVVTAPGSPYVIGVVVQRQPARVRDLCGAGRIARDGRSRRGGASPASTTR